MSFFKKVLSESKFDPDETEPDLSEDSECNLINITISINKKHKVLKPYGNKQNKINSIKSDKLPTLKEYIESNVFSILLIKEEIYSGQLFDRLFALRDNNRNIISFKGNSLYFKTKRKARVIRDNILLNTGHRLFLTKGADHQVKM